MDILIDKRLTMLTIRNVIIASLFWFTFVSSFELAELESELVELRNAASDKVIVMRESDFEKFALNNERSYELAIFLMATQLIDQEGLQLRKLRSEFALAAKAFASGPNSTKIFFVEVVFEDSPSVFHKFEARQLPFVFRLAPGKRISSHVVNLLSADKLTHENAGSGYPWSAETFSEFYSSRSGLNFEPIQRPKFTDDPKIRALMGLGVLAMISLAYAVYRSPLLRHPAIYLLGALAIFWFSSSGGMYNIIRGMPLYTRREGKLVFFIPNRGAQLGAEGYMMGTAYLVFSTCIALIMYLIPVIPSKSGRYSLTAFLMLLAVYTVYKSFAFYVFKSGHQIVPYLF